MSFFQRIGSSNYHTTKTCSKVPDNVAKNANWKSLKSRPKGIKKCAECTNKESKAKKPVKKKVAAKKKGTARGRAKKK